jgi:hypothetical protein
MRMVVAILLAITIGLITVPVVSFVTSSKAEAAKKETCWRTNRATKQRFRIC